jgi:hypothetical protein
MTEVPVIAANPGPAAHLALLGAVIVIGLIVFAIVRARRRREAAEAEQLNRQDETTQSSDTGRNNEP